MTLPLRIGKFPLSTRLLLAPMAGYTDFAFRSGIRNLGGFDLAYTEMLNPRSVMQGGGFKRKALLATGPADTPLGWQIYGSDPVLMAECACFLCETRKSEIIDINMGCPQRKISGRGDGAALMCKPELARRIAATVAAAAPVPVTVKMRIGWDAEHKTAPGLAADMAGGGIAAITIHGRTGKQKYTGRADLRAIRDVVEAVGGSIPVIGNGDIVSPPDARRMLDETGCAAVMIGRAALGNPWIFQQTAEYLKQGEILTRVSQRRRLDFLLAHFDRTGFLYGQENAVKLFRKWIPQHAGALGIRKQRMVELMQLRESNALRLALERCSESP